MLNVKINSNGDTAQSLLTELQAAMEAVTAAQVALTKLTIHGRNYQTCDDPKERWQTDRLERVGHVVELGNMYRWLHASMEHIIGQVEA